jgi:hypothetical protein
MRRGQLQYALAIVAGGVIELNGLIQLVGGSMGLGIAGLIAGGILTVFGVVMLMRPRRPGGG